MDLASVDLSGMAPDLRNIVTGSTRLIQRQWLSEDGAKFVETGIFDTKEQVYCGFTLAEDRRMRCLPAASALFGYTDAACTQPVSAVYKLAACSDSRRWALRLENATCPEVYSLWQRASSVAPSKFYLKDNGLCTDVSSQISAYDFYALTRRNPSDFVAAELR